MERNPDQATLLRVVRDYPEELIERLRQVPSDCREFFEFARTRTAAGQCQENDIERAARAYGRCRLSFGGAGHSFSFESPGGPGLRWERGIKELRAISRRLQGVRILVGDALRLLPQLDGPEALFYLDPPYVRSARSPSPLYGRFEMTDDAHHSLCRLALQLKGKVALSGYPNKIYDELLSGWRRVEREVPHYARPGAGPRKAKLEVLWMNY